MSTFMLTSDRFTPVAQQGTIPDGFTDQWCDLVRPEVLDLADCAAFPIAWDTGNPAVLTAMSADGAGVAAAVLPRLDLVTLAELLARAGQVATRSWSDLARRYPRGLGAFRRDWNAFREASVIPVAPPPALVVITGSLSAQVRQALPLLGRVQILLAQVRRGADGAHLLDLDPVLLEQPTPSRPAAASSPSAPARRVRPSSAPTGLPAADSPAHAPSSGAPAGTRAPRVSTSAAARHPAPSASTPVRARTPRTAPVHPSAQDCPDLKLVASMVGAPVPIEYRHGTRHQPAILHPEGRVVFPDGSEYADLHRASAALSHPERTDPWQTWRFTDGQFPLAEARTEARQFHGYSNGHTSAPATGRRAAFEG